MTRSPRRGSSPVNFRLLTYNIHKGIGGVDRRYRLDRTIATIRRLVPDIAFLQEVDEGVPRSRAHRQVDLLADALEMRYRLYQPNVTLKLGRYGNAILSRFPLTDVRDIELTIPMKKRRRGLAAHCRLRATDRSRSLLLVNVHLGLAGFERVMQVRKLLNTDVIQNVHNDTPVIVAGDCNDVWNTLGRRLFRPAGFHLASGDKRTFPAVMPVRALDRVFCRGNVEVAAGFASRSDVARQASDHLPLVVDFQIPF